MMIFQRHKTKAIFVIYICLVLLITHFSMDFRFRIDFTDIRYNLIPFNLFIERLKVLKEISEAGYNAKDYLIPCMKIMFESFGYNIILFLPFGILLPIAYKEYTTLKKTMLASFIFSIFIETSQAVVMAITITSNRSFDVDDIIANTLGGTIGFYIHILIRKVSLAKTPLYLM